MDNQRLLLFFALALVVMLIWDAWIETYGPTPNESLVTNPVTTTDNLNEGVIPQGDTIQSVPTAPESIDLPSDPSSTTDNLSSKSVAVTNAPKPAQLSKSSRIRVITDHLDLEISTLGGDIRRAFLLSYPITSDKPDEPYPLMGDKLPQFFIAQSGLLAKDNAPAPGLNAKYVAEKLLYQLMPGQHELVVPLTWESPEGLKVTKIFTFKRDEYVIKVDHIVTNNTGVDWKGRLYRQLQRMEYDEPNKSRLLYTFTGAAVSTPEKPYEKISYDEFKEWNSEPRQSYYTGGWIAMLQHYFVTAWIPDQQEVNHFYSRVSNDARYSVGLTSAEKEIAANSEATLSTQLFIGPKVQDRLEVLAPHLKLVVDYGWLTFISQPLFWLLEWFYSLVNNWGWSIVLLTLTIKLAFYKLSEASYRSMGNMRRVAPKFKAIRERYGEDRQRMSQAMMKLYKEEKVNPMSGCWPVALQIPVFLSLYWVLLESVEIRQADFVLWITDLSARDPYYVLPILMGASMYIQQKLSQNPSLDPMHQKIMQYLPLIFTAFFMLFPAGLVLYWVVNNTLSILQQWYILNKLEKEYAKGKTISKVNLKK